MNYTKQHERKRGIRKRPHAEARRRRAFVRKIFILLRYIIFNEEHEINKIIFQTTTLRPLRLCASA